jgi:phosphoribosylformylglycinamidine synthase
MSIDCIGAICSIDPYEGAKSAVAEAARNVSCSGGEPIGVTNCLNFGSPEKPEVFWFLERAIAGLSDASKALNVPITGGNVSLYNESPTGAIDPTPVIGMIGLFEDVEKRATQWFKADGDFVYFLGEIGSSIGASRYLKLLHGKKTGRVAPVDLAKEDAIQKAVREVIKMGLVQSAHDCSEGGFAVALAECCFTGSTHEEKSHGVTVDLPGDGRLDGRLFGEAPSRIIVSCKPDQAAKLEETVRDLGIPVTKIGTVGGDHIKIGEAVDVPVAKAAETFFTAIEKRMGA